MDTSSSENIITINVPKFRYALRLIQKAINISKIQYVTIEQTSSELFLYIESLLTNLKLFYKFDNQANSPKQPHNQPKQTTDTVQVNNNQASDDIFGSLDFNNLEESAATIVNNKTIKITVNSSFINTLLLINDIVDIKRVTVSNTADIGNNDDTSNTKSEIVITSKDCIITYSELQQNDLTTSDFEELIQKDYVDIVDKSCLSLVSKALASIDELAYKKSISIYKDKVYTSNNNFIIENRSSYTVSQKHNINYTILDFIKLIDIKDHVPLYLYSTEEYTYIKYHTIYVRFDNLAVSSDDDSMLNLIDLSRFKPVIITSAKEFNKLKLLALGGTIDNYDEIIEDTITIQCLPNKPTLATKGRDKNITRIANKIQAPTPFKFNVNYKTLLKAVLMSNSEQISLLIDSKEEYETLIIQGNNVEIAIALEDIFSVPKPQVTPQAVPQVTPQAVPQAVPQRS